MSGAVPPPAARPLERAARVPRPVCPGCGRCGGGDPARAPQRAPLRAGVARCGGGGRASSERVPSAVVRGVCGQALPLPRRLLGSVTHMPWARVCGCGVLMTLLWRRQENTALLSNCGLTGTPRHVSLLGLGGEGRTGGVHSADVDGVELPSQLLAEAQSIDCVMSAVYFSTAQGTAPVHPDPPTCTTEANGLGSRRRNQDTLHVLYAS